MTLSRTSAVFISLQNSPVSQKSAQTESNNNTTDSGTSTLEAFPGPAAVSQKHSLFIELLSAPALLSPVPHESNATRQAAVAGLRELLPDRGMLVAEIHEQVTRVREAVCFCRHFGQKTKRKRSRAGLSRERRVGQICLRSAGRAAGCRRSSLAGPAVAVRRRQRTLVRVLSASRIHSAVLGHSRENTIPQDVQPNVI
ncbi:Hypothetical_protein [Hexamita inflata]|uniref:Hypothetical_protein n=1 Tax=Hexamita inflata TaxID=28002 RepID=A0ABP1H1S1_9EUKA